MSVEIKDGKYILTGVFTEFSNWTRNRTYYRKYKRIDKINRIFN